MLVKFEVNGQVQLSRNLRITQANIKNMGEFIGEALDIVHERSNEIFNTAGKNVEKNPQWKPLKPKTIAYKRRKFGTTTPLINTGNLKNNTSKTIGKESGTLKYNAEYAIYHQEGNPKLPRRAIIDLNNDTNNKITKALQQKINRDIGIFGKQV